MSVRVHCRTNLDDVREQWPDNLPERPIVGDLIESKTVWGGDFQLRLEVVGLTWTFNKSTGEWYLMVELHIPKCGQPRSIVEWQQWYKRATGRTPSFE